MKLKGFSLVEMMVVVCIIGILMGIAYPTYTGYVSATRRGAAMTAILNIMQYQERYRTKESTYTTNFKDLGYLGSTIKTDGDHYVITAEDCAPAPCVKLIATPLGGQADNDDNQILTLDTIGRRTGPWQD